MSKGLIVSKVIKDSIAAEMEIEPGDIILRVDDHKIGDVLDLQYWTSEEEFTMLIEKINEEIWELEINKLPGEILGIETCSVSKNGLIRCNNNCVFCFILQMPSGLRESLYDRDDDYRLSVTQGSYITLSNLTSEDFGRIIKLHLSPLFISVHAWNPMVREKMMKNRQAGKLAEQIKTLAEAGLTLHTQIVLVPGVNDDEILRETVENLAALFPAVQSIGVVPVGLTKYRDGLPDLKPLTPEGAKKVLDLGVDWQKKYKRVTGKNLVYFSDEFYVLTCIDFPEAHEYDDFPQLENGIGMAGKLQAEISDYWRELPKKIQQRRIHLVTGVSAANYFRSLARKLTLIEGLNIMVHEITNSFFGSFVTVAGLLTAQDIAEQLGNLQGESFLISKLMLKADEDIFLDGYDISWLEQRVNGKAVIVENSGKALLEALLGMSIGGIENE